jgi:hypothetical protein
MKILVYSICWFLLLALLVSCDCDQNTNGANATPENSLPQVGKQLSKNYNLFRIAEANEKWTKYHVCSVADCTCQGSNFEYYVTCDNNGNILSIWSGCE